MTEPITSHHNEKLKSLRKLQDKKHRVETGLFVAEGEDLVEAALAHGWQVEQLFYVSGAPGEGRWSGERGATPVVAEALASVSGLGSGSRVVAVIRQQWEEPGGQLSLYLDRISDPGNVGTSLRSALAFADGPVVIGPGTADPYSPKAVRASMGALFVRPPARAPVDQMAGTIIALDGGSDVTIAEAALRGAGPFVVCVGSERDGLSDSVKAAAMVSASIPMLSTGPESLNAAMAATVALYEVSRNMQSVVQSPGAAGQKGGDQGAGKNSPQSYV